MYNNSDMRKFLPVLLVALILILTVFVILTIKQDTKETVPVAGNNSGVSDSEVNSAVTSEDLNSGTLRIFTKTGVVKEIRGQFGTDDFTELSEDFDLLFEPADVNEAEMYDIYYDELGGLILVTLHREPLTDARIRAVEKLEEKLGIRASELCDLNVSVITNSYVSTVFSSLELGIPGCANEVNLDGPAN